MAYANDIRSRSGIARTGFAEFVTGFARMVVEGSEQRRVYRQTVRELGALSERELADLGIHRAMITKIAHEAAYSK